MAKENKHKPDYTPKGTYTKERGWELNKTDKNPDFFDEEDDDSDDFDDSED
jgi:hypothetical protein